MAQAALAPSDLTHATLLEQKEGLVVLGLPGTSYRLHLAVSDPVNAKPNARIKGRILARARRVDRMKAGGRFIEPIYGRPRTIQGAVVAVDPEANVLTIDCGCPFHCTLVADQRSGDFQVGELVGCHIERGAVFEPEE